MGAEKLLRPHALYRHSVSGMISHFIRWAEPAATHYSGPLSRPFIVKCSICDFNAVRN